MKKEGSLFVISGPSGSGKTTLAQSLLEDKKLKKVLVKSVSLTTRKKRSGEKDKKDYFFVSRERFFALRREKKILEWTRYLGYYYATLKSATEANLKRGNNILLCLDLNGALKLKKLYPRNAVTIFIVPPSLRDLKKRIINRCRKTCSKEIEKRLSLVKKELQSKKLYDHYVVNKDFSLALVKLKKIVLKELVRKQTLTRSA